MGITNISEHLQQLKRDIKAINPEQNFARTEPLVSKEASQRFADIKLLPKTVSANTEDFVSPSDSTYSDNVLQTIWNIADIFENSLSASGAYDLYMDDSKLRENFAYLDETLTHIPKIIDEKTYKAAKALLNTINLIEKELKETLEYFYFLEYFYLGSRYESIKAVTHDITNLLNHRIKVYEFHRPENLQINLKIALKLRSGWDEKYKSLISETRDQLSNQIHRDPVIVDELKDNLDQLKTLRPLLQNNLQELKNFRAQNQDLNNKLDMELSIETSPYSEILLNYYLFKDEKNPAFQNLLSNQLIEAWREIYNEETKFKTRDLSTDFKKSIDRQIKELDEILEQATKQESRIAEKLKVAKILERVKQAPIGRKIELEINASNNEEPVKNLEENISLYNQLIKELTNYLNELENSKPLNNERLHAFQHQFKIPDSIIEEAKAIYIGKIEEEQKAIQSSIYNAQEKRAKLESELGKLSVEVRQKIVAEADKRVDLASEKFKSAIKGIERLEIDNRRFIDNYEDSVKKIKESNDPEKEIKIKSMLAIKKEIEQGQMLKQYELPLTSLQLNSDLALTAREIIKFEYQLEELEHKLSEAQDNVPMDSKIHLIGFTLQGIQDRLAFHHREFTKLKESQINFDGKEKNLESFERELKSLGAKQVHLAEKTNQIQKLFQRIEKLAFIREQYNSLLLQKMDAIGVYQLNLNDAINDEFEKNKNFIEESKQITHPFIQRLYKEIEETEAYLKLMNVPSITDPIDKEWEYNQFFIPTTILGNTTASQNSNSFFNNGEKQQETPDFFKSFNVFWEAMVFLFAQAIQFAALRAEMSKLLDSLANLIGTMQAGLAKENPEEITTKSAKH